MSLTDTDTFAAFAAKAYSKVLQELDDARIERDEARLVAAVLAHAYTKDSRPPAYIVEQALAYPVAKHCE
jgi:hypothetical protein